MKKSQNKKNHSSFKAKNNDSIKRIWSCFYGLKEVFSFAVFQSLKAENEKLPIVYANIRV